MSHQSLMFILLANYLTQINKADDILKDFAVAIVGRSVRFLEFQILNQIQGVEIDEESVSNVGCRKCYKFIAHGWHENSNVKWYRDLTNALLEKYRNCAVIQVDWRDLAQAEYLIATQNTKVVGANIGKLIVKIHEKCAVPLRNFHVIGHSLGGHVAGYSGKEVRASTKSRIGKITALDPAGPMFGFPKMPASQRLSEKDALVVEAIHTDGGYFGYKDRIGTHDYFANGGTRIQPGCETEKTGILDLQTILTAPKCGHKKSHEYYIRAMNGEKFLMIKCNSWRAYQNGRCKNSKHLRLGDQVGAKNKGSYYFRTR